MNQKRYLWFVATVVAGVFLFSASAFCADIKARMKDRLPRIIELKAAGVIGENNQGFLGLHRRQPVGEGAGGRGKPGSATGLRRHRQAAGNDRRRGWTASGAADCRQCQTRGMAPGCRRQVGSKITRRIRFDIQSVQPGIGWRPNGLAPVGCSAHPGIPSRRAWGAWPCGGISRPDWQNSPAAAHWSTVAWDTVVPTPAHFREGSISCITRDWRCCLRSLRQCGVRDYLLVGHSDGGSIALIHAGGGPCPGLKGIVTLAAHVFCEGLTRRSIEAARQRYLNGDLKARLSPYHGKNTHCAFWGWNDVWLHPDFRGWRIDDFLPSIHVPVLAIQGETDPYGSLVQLDVIQGKTGDGVAVEVVAGCGHAPHLEKTDAVLGAISAFMRHRIHLID